MTRDEAAKRLNGGEYGSEGSKELFAEMKAAGLVAVFGASDDLMEFRGAVYEEAGACGGGEVSFTPAGLLETEHDQYDCQHCPYFAKLEKAATPVKALWDREGFSWVYETEIPHATFVISEDGEPYCRGIVFALVDAPEPGIERAARACYDVTTSTLRSAFPPGFEQRGWDELEEKERVLHRGYARAALAA